MKHLFLVALAILLANLVKAQSEYPNLVETRRAFQPILDYNIPTGILKDVNLGNGVLDRHQGFENDSLNDPIEFLDIVQNLKNSASNYNILPSKETILSTIGEFKKAGFVPISLISYQYAYLDDTTDTDLIMSDTSDGTIRFAKDPTGHFYLDTVRAFAAHGALTNGSLSIKYIFPSSLYFSNTGLLPNAVINFGDGKGWKVINFDVPYYVEYPPFDGYIDTVEVQLRWLDQPTFLPEETTTTTKKFKTNWPDPNTNFMISTVKVNNSCLNPDETAMNDARVNIRYGRAQAYSRLLRKPFILVEGFDVDLNPNDERFGSVEWSSFVAGLSFDERGNPTRENLKDLKVLSDKLHDLNYDCIFIDFKDGSGDMFKNGNALIKIIQWVNENKYGDEEIVVMGASMGGLLARYAIRTMEIEGCNPCVKLYGTFDSPHQGANLPLSIQYAMKGMAHLSTDAEMAFKLLFARGAQHMLVENLSDPNKVHRNKWQNRLNEIGHPQSPKRIAITNGSPAGKNNEIQNPGVLLFSYGINLTVEGYLGKNKLILMDRWDFHPLVGGRLFSKSSNVKDTIYSFITIRKTFLDSLKSENSDISKVALDLLKSERQSAPFVGAKFHQDGLSLDHVAGGQADWLKLLSSAINNIDVDVKSTSQNVKVQVSRVSNNFTGNDMFTTFVPTYSGLDMKNLELNPDLKNSFPIVNLENSALIPNEQIHPFHAIFFHSDENNPNKNQEHVFVDGRKDQNVDFIINQLNSMNNKLPSIVPTGLPNEYVYNFNSADKQLKRIKSISIKHNGILKLNNEGHGEFGNSSKPTKSDNHMLFRTSSCANGITIENGGQLIVGDNNNELGKNNRASLYITPGSSIEIKENGKMTIHRGSKVIIEPGATLIFHDEARIELFGEASALEIQGKILIKDGATFKLIESTDDIIGRLILVHTSKNKGASLEAEGTNSKIHIAGNEAYKGEQFKIQNGPLVLKGFQKVELEKLEIRNTPKSHLEVYCPLNIQFVHFKGDDSDKTNTTAIKTFGQSGQFIERNLFDDYENAIHLSDNNLNSAVKIGYNIFEQCGTALMVERCKPDIRHNEFKSCGEVMYLISSENGVIHSNRFENNRTAIFSDKANANANLSVTDNLFLNNQSGINFPAKTDVTLDCNRFYGNQKGIYSTGTINMSSSKTMNNNTGGYNTFVSNQIGIELEGGALFLENGYNNFIGRSGSGSHNFIKGSIDQNCACLNTSLQLKAADNHWFPAPFANDLTQGVNTYYQISANTSPHPLVVKLNGALNKNPDYTCYKPYDTDLPSQNSQTKNSEDISLAGSFIHVYPNPWVKGPLKIELQQKSESNILICLTHLNGVEIFKQNFQHYPSSKFTLEIPESNQLSAGIYILTITSDNKSERIKIIK